MRWPAIVAMVAGCVTADGDVLSVGALLTNCEQVPGRQSDDQACNFTEVCAVPDPRDPACCQTFVSCRDGLLQFDPYCSPNCRSCVDDSACPPGMAVCDGNQCVACTDPGMCEPCPAGLAPVVRNGCRTCACARPTECAVGGPCPNGEQCYPGMVCAPGCSPADAGCCANVCAATGCPSPAPLGCDTACADPTCTEGCVTTACECVDARWVCRAGCGQRSGVCFQPT